MGLFFTGHDELNEDENERYVLRPQSPQTAPKTAVVCQCLSPLPDVAAAKRGHVGFFFNAAALLPLIIAN